MSYTTPPTFADDAVLSAAQLNILSDDIAYLYGLASAVNPPFQRAGGASGAGGTWLIRHRADYLYAGIEWVKGGDPGADFPFMIRYNGNTLVDTFLTGDSSAAYQLDLTGLGLTEGDFYEIEVESYTGSYFGTYIYLNYLFEAN